MAFGDALGKGDGATVVLSAETSSRRKGLGWGSSAGSAERSRRSGRSSRASHESLCRPISLLGLDPGLARTFGSGGSLEWGSRFLQQGSVRPHPRSKISSMSSHTQTRCLATL